MRIILILSLLVILCSATDGVSNLRRSLDVVPQDVILKFKIGSDGTEVYIQDNKIVKKNKNEFTYYEAGKTQVTDGKSKYKPKAQFECTGQEEGQQTLTICTSTNPNPCTDTLGEFIINYKTGGEEDPETDTPAEKGNKEIGDGRELTTYTAEFVDGSGPSGAGDISIVTSDTTAINIMKDYTNKDKCSVNKDTTKPVPDDKVLKFKLKSGETVVLSDTKALKQNGEGYTYYDVGKEDSETQSKYTLTPKYVCDGNKQSTSLTTCEGKSDSKCTAITYTVKYTTASNTAEFVGTVNGLEGGITVEDKDKSEVKWHDKDSDCPTGSDTTTKPVPPNKVLKFTLKTGEIVFLSDNQGLKKNGNAYSYYDVDKDDTTTTYSTYTLTPVYVCDGNKQSTSLTTCNKQKDGECKEITYNIQYTESTSKAEFVNPSDDLKDISITIQDNETEADFDKYDEANNCPTGSGGDGIIHPSDLSAIPQNANVKQNTTGNSYVLITDNVFYVIGKEYQLAIPVTKIQGEHNSTYSVTENTDFIKKSTGLKIKDDDKILDTFKCPASKNKFISLIWLERNCNETLVNEYMEDEVGSYKSANSYILGVNASIVYFYVDQTKQFIKFGEIVENIDIMEDKSWFVYPSLLLSIIFIIIF